MGEPRAGSRVGVRQSGSGSEPARQVRAGPRQSTGETKRERMRVGVTRTARVRHAPRRRAAAVSRSGTALGAPVSPARTLRPPVASTRWPAGPQIARSGSTGQVMRAVGAAARAPRGGRDVVRARVGPVCGSRGSHRPGRPPRLAGSVCPRSLRREPQHRGLDEEREVCSGDGGVERGTRAHPVPRASREGPSVDRRRR